MTFTITKEFAFSASHALEGLPDSHQCARLHGHNYVVAVRLESASLNPVGFVLDYGDLAPLRDYIDGALDHRHLNDVLHFNPTAERLAQWLYEVCAGQGWPVAAVGVSETPKTWAWFE